MIKVKTKSGFEAEIDENVINNMELVDALEDVSDSNPLAISKVCKLILGEKTRKKLYDHIRNKDGRVPIEDISKEIMDIFEAFGDKGKNS